MTESTTDETKPRKSIDEMRPLVAEWEESGLSQSEFARIKGLRLSTFGYWVRRITRQDQQSSLTQLCAPKNGLVAVQLTDDAEPIEIIVSGDVVLRIPPRFDANTLRQLLQELGAC